MDRPMARWVFAGAGRAEERDVVLGCHQVEGGEVGDFGFHLCRGNQGSRWLVEGGYEAVARTIFGTVGVRRLLLEYDDARSGDFRPLAHLPDDRSCSSGW
jgi:5-methyltetrahydropteroyltriglutamate--homocysteine methyltransferase